MLMSEGARQIHVVNEIQNKGKWESMPRPLGSVEPSESPGLRKQAERPGQNQFLAISA